jgi:hypothetical protein
VTLFILLAMTIFQLLNGSPFVWRNIEPMDQPGLFARLLYSALTFVTIGALLYFIRFYQLLSSLFGHDRQGYRSAKKLIWLGLMYLMFTVLVPTGVNILNTILSFVYNIFVLMLYLSPIASSILVVIIIISIHKQSILQLIKKTTKREYDER